MLTSFLATAPIGYDPITDDPDEGTLVIQLTPGPGPYDALKAEVYFYVQFQGESFTGSFDDRINPFFRFSGDAAAWMLYDTNVLFMTRLGNGMGASRLEGDFNDFYGLAPVVFYFSGPAVEAPTGQPFGSTMSIGLFNREQTASLLPTTHPDGFLFTIEIAPDGSITPRDHSIPPGRSHFSDPVQIPEPATHLSAVGAITLLGLIMRFRKRI